MAQPNEKTERNQEIYERVQNGASPTTLAHEYGIAYSNIQRIIKRERDREREQIARARTSDPSIPIRVLNALAASNPSMTVTEVLAIHEAFTS